MLSGSPVTKQNLVVQHNNSYKMRDETTKHTCSKFCSCRAMKRQIELLRAQFQSILTLHGFLSTSLAQPKPVAPGTGHPLPESSVALLVSEDSEVLSISQSISRATVLPFSDLAAQQLLATQLFGQATQNGTAVHRIGATTSGSHENVLNPLLFKLRNVTQQLRYAGSPLAWPRLSRGFLHWVEQNRIPNELLLNGLIDCLESPLRDTTIKELSDEILAPESP